jgi:hypothetical protein
MSDDGFLLSADYPPGDAYCPAAVYRPDGSLRLADGPCCPYGDELRGADTLPELLLLVSRLGEDLAPRCEGDDYTRRKYTTCHGPELARELWAAMRRLGGAAPPPMPAALLEHQGGGPERKLYVDYLRGKELPFSPEVVLAAVDMAADWCFAQMPAAPKPGCKLSPRQATQRALYRLACDNDLAPEEAAEEVGYSKSWLYGEPEFQRLWPEIKSARRASPPPDGSKDKEGRTPEARDEAV